MWKDEIKKNIVAKNSLMRYIQETKEEIEKRLDYDEGNGIRQYLEKMLEEMLFAAHSL